MNAQWAKHFRDTFNLKLLQDLVAEWRKEGDAYSLWRAQEVEQVRRQLVGELARHFFYSLAEVRDGNIEVGDGRYQRVPKSSRRPAQKAKR
jgi:hypothetical protein